MYPFAFGVFDASIPVHELVRCWVHPRIGREAYEVRQWPFQLAAELSLDAFDAKVVFPAEAELSFPNIGANHVELARRQDIHAAIIALVLVANGSRQRLASFPVGHDHDVAPDPAIS